MRAADEGSEGKGENDERLLQGRTRADKLAERNEGSMCCLGAGSLTLNASEFPLILQESPWEGALGRRPSPTLH